MRCVLALIFVSLAAACGPPSKPQPPVRERPRPTKLTDAVAYQVYQRLLAKVRAAHKSKAPIDLKVLLAGQLRKIPAGCNKTGTVVRRLLIPPNDTVSGKGAAAKHLVMLLLLEPRGYYHCECPSSCDDKSSLLTACSIALHAPQGGTPTLVVTSPKVAPNAHSDDFFPDWSERPRGRLLLTLRYASFYPQCGNADAPQKSGTEVELVGVHQGRLHSYISMTARHRVKRGTFLGTVETNYEWVNPADHKDQLLRMTDESYRRDESTHPRTGDPEVDVGCSRSHSFWRLDLKANELKKVSKAEVKRLLTLPAHESLRKSAMSGSTLEKCTDLVSD